MASPRSALAEPIIHDEVGHQSKLRTITRLSFFLGCAAVLTWSTQPFDQESTATRASSLWTFGSAGIPRSPSVALQPRMIPGATSSQMPRIMTCHYDHRDGYANKKGSGAPDHSHGGLWGAAVVPSAPTMPPGLDKLGDLTEKFTVGGGQKGVVCLTKYIIAYRTNQRRGNACTKTRGEVSGGGRKPYKQKKTGNARLGSIRSPLKVGGGVIFGPKPKRWHMDVNHKEKKLAMQRAFWEAAVTGVVEVVEDGFGVTTGKTKEGQAWFDAHKIQLPKKEVGYGGRTPKEPWHILVDDEWDDLVHRGLRNIEKIQMSRAAQLNPYNVVRADKIFITKKGLDVVLERMNLCEEEEEEKEPVPA